MAIDIASLVNIAESIKDFFEKLSTKKLEKNERFKVALKALLTAANETRTYLAGLKSYKKHNTEKESHIASLWSEAAVQLLEFDKDLAQICSLEGNYWSDPREWSYREINHAKRVLRVIDGQIHRLLEGSGNN